MNGPIRLVDWFWFHLADWALLIFGWNILEGPPVAPVSIGQDVPKTESNPSPLRVYLFYDEIVRQVQPSIDETLGYLNSLITQMLVFGHDMKQVSTSESSANTEVSKGRDEVIQSILAEAHRTSSESRSISKKLTDEYEMKFDPVSSEVSRLEDEKQSHQNILQECTVRESRLQQLAEDLQDPAFANRSAAQNQINDLVHETEQQTKAAQLNLSQIDQDIQSRSGEHERLADERMKIKHLDMFLDQFACYISVMKTITIRHLKPSAIMHVMHRLFDFIQNDAENHLSNLATKEVLNSFAGNVSRFKYSLKTGKVPESDIDQVTQAIADELITSEMAKHFSS